MASDYYVRSLEKYVLCTSIDNSFISMPPVSILDSLYLAKYKDPRILSPQLKDSDKQERSNGILVKTWLQ